MADPVRDLTPAERAVLERLCADDWPGAEAARVQLATARFGGHSHGPGDNCFDIVVAEDAPRIARADGPVHGLNVFDGDEATGAVDLWVRDGRLHSMEHSWYPDEPGPMPTPEQLRA